LEKGIFISAIQPGTAVEGLFCVSSKRILETRNKEPYLAITLTDRTGEIEGRIWDEVKRLDSVFLQGDYVRIKGEAQKFRETTQLKITYLESIKDDSVDPGLFLPVTEADIDELWSEFKKYVSEIKCDTFAVLLKEIFKDQKIKKAFKTAPAGKRMHHAYIGGLLEHSLSVTKLANSLCSLYSHLDRDLLISAALIHDIGKIYEFNFSRPPIDYSDKGRLIGHVVMGISIIDGFVAKLGIKESSEKIIALKHLVLSHHGQREFGAPIVPMMEEAMVLNYIDDLDAKLNYLKGLKRDVSPACASHADRGQDYCWTDYQRLLDRHFYLPACTSQTGRQIQNKATEGKDLTEAKEDADDACPDQSPVQSDMWSNTKAW
jgi:3'-5' exoribonuclease